MKITLTTKMIAAASVAHVNAIALAIAVATNRKAGDVIVSGTEVLLRCQKTYYCRTTQYPSYWMAFRLPETVVNLLRYQEKYGGHAFPFEFNLSIYGGVPK